MVGVIAAVAGLVVGALVAWLVSARRSQALRDELVATRSNLAVRESQLESAQILAERQHAEHVNAMVNMEQTFENLRDLNFEYKAGKLSDADFHSMRDAMEQEAANILAEIEEIERESGARQEVSA